MLNGSAFQMYNPCSECAGVCMPTAKRENQAMNSFGKGSPWNALSGPELGEN